MRTITFVLLVSLSLLFISTSAFSQTRNVTFIVNTCTIPDTVGPNYNIQLRGNRLPLTWGNDTGGRMTNIGGDYWSKTLAFHVGDTIRFKIFAGTNGWESDVIPDPPTLPGDPNRGYVVANCDTVLPLQFFNYGTTTRPQYFRPWTEVPDSFLSVWFRVIGVTPRLPQEPDTFGVRGNGPPGSDLTLDHLFRLRKEVNSTLYPQGYFWSGRVRIPISQVVERQEITFRFGDTYGDDEYLPDPPYTGGFRSFPIPVGKRDTTLQFKFFGECRPRVNRDTVVIRYRVDLWRAIVFRGFSITDTLVVRSGYFGTTTTPWREKRMIRIGTSTSYGATDTIVTLLGYTFDYQYYLIKNAQDVRENYYNYFYNGGVISEAERRQVIVPGNVFTIADTFSSVVHARRQPDFPNSRILTRRVTVRWEVDVRPAIYQVAHGDTLLDLQGNRSITNRDSVMTNGVWMNGLATGGWQSFGIVLRADTSRKMYDDGTHGDRVAGDSVFTRIIVAAPESLGIGTKGQVGQVFKFGLGGGDNEGGRGGFGNNHQANINDSLSAFTMSEQWGSINPAFYSCWDYDARRPTCTLVSVAQEPTPRHFMLAQNYPNPFNPTTHIEYIIAEESYVSLKVYNVLGQEVATLVGERQTPGKYVKAFDASHLLGGRHGLASGIYFYRLTTGQFTSVKKMVFIR